MPLYEYECQECHHTFEKLVRDSGDVVECPECHRSNPQRQLSMPAKPVVKSTSSLPMSCKSSGPHCSRW